MRELNPEEWKNIVGLMKGTAVWDEVVRKLRRVTAGMFICLC